MIELPKKDLISLAADKDAEFALRGLYERGQSLRIRTINADIFVHPEHDPGCLLKSPEFLRPFAKGYERALVILDLHGSGKEDRPREELEDSIESKLAGNGWTKDRVCAIVITPELEAWVWSDSTQVDQQLSWMGRQTSLRRWLFDNGFIEKSTLKPADPKQAFESALRQVKLPRSASIFKKLALTVGLERCNDPAFSKFRETLQRWFPL